MSNRAFGLDFGTTNSLAAVVEGGRVDALDDSSGRPHPSVVWYRGSEIVIGREAKDSMDLIDGGAPSGFVRSPKTALRRDGPLYVDGRPIDPIDAVAEVLKYVREDAGRQLGQSQAESLERVVMTIPVDFGGIERRALRQAARKAGIGIIQFVHEPSAALYAYLRSQADFNKSLSRLEGQLALVFDWGGGTLDLTLCRIQGGSILQIANLGDSDIGGDRFDERLRNLLREKHAMAHDIDDVTSLEQPGMAAKLLNQCEIVKIALSAANAGSEPVIVRNFLRTGSGRDLVDSVTKDELENQTADIIRRGLASIDKLLADAGRTYQDVSLCLATGGMVNMPAIRNGLTERFQGRVPHLSNGDRIIAEGAAWIAYDGVRLALSKPIEILVADTTGFGTYSPLVDAGWKLPVENKTQSVSNSKLFCTDPRDGIAMVEIAKPMTVGRTTLSDPRRTICIASVEVDPKAAPLMERINCELQIDHDYVAKLVLTSSTLGDRSTTEFYDLEFGLTLPNFEQASAEKGPLSQDERSAKKRDVKASPSSNVVLRSNVGRLSKNTMADRQLVPGDLATKWWPNYFDVQSRVPTPRQREERLFYEACALCGRLPTQISAEGCEEAICRVGRGT
jgi:molecular chaperone DnaK